MRYRLSADARSQLDAIAYYIALDNEAAAIRAYNNILDTFEMIAEMPSIGRHPQYVKDMDILCCNVRKYDDYLIFYKEVNEEVLILWVLHGARDLPNLIG